MSYSFQKKSELESDQASTSNYQFSDIQLAREQLNITVVVNKKTQTIKNCAPTSPAPSQSQQLVLHVPTHPVRWVVHGRSGYAQSDDSQSHWGRLFLPCCYQRRFIQIKQPASNPSHNTSTPQVQWKPPPRQWWSSAVNSQCPRSLVLVSTSPLLKDLDQEMSTQRS